MSRLNLAFCGCLLLLLPWRISQAAANLLIWPIDPILTANDNATPLWLENQGKTPVTLQVRIVRWRQETGRERYSSQQDVAASPPVIRVEPQNKQLVRLMKQTAVPAGQEWAYRIVVDEIPQPSEAGSAANLGVKLQMRYSIPLFVYGVGRTTQRDAANHVSVDASKLAWGVMEEAGQRLLWVRNRDNVHVRLSQVSLEGASGKNILADGLLGYVLAGSERRWPLPSAFRSAAKLTATINATHEQWHATPSR
ncbi:molecular chaperone [Erwinia sp. HR93]|uniref:fimbrial biogenesis chaperone n=1 Tax=Erwinia sp. HR93 TaxID=3094840 RepID=UPI002ADEC639|nr:molecular chaperone [Erwinia sp. HR93]MEA1064097.1 molecular chaperone [Erwinia sp. HR93]